MASRDKAFPLSLNQVVAADKSTKAPARSIKEQRTAMVTQKVGLTHSSTITATARHVKVVPPKVSGLGLDSARARQALAERLRGSGIQDERVLNAIASIPRHLFVDAGLASQAYEDTALPIGYEQTISKPSIVARMIALLRHGMLAQNTLGRVLEIGTGCGYQAAVLSQVAQEVYSIERIKPLYEKAKTNLRTLRISNLRLHYGDGMLGLPAQAPFDAIILAAAGMMIPQALREQLAIGGKLIAPVAHEAGQILKITVRQSETVFQETELETVLFVPLKSGVI